MRQLTAFRTAAATNERDCMALLEHIIRFLSPRDAFKVGVAALERHIEFFMNDSPGTSWLPEWVRLVKTYEPIKQGENPGGYYEDFSTVAEQLLIQAMLCLNWAYEGVLNEQEQPVQDNVSQAVSDILSIRMGAWRSEHFPDLQPATEEEIAAQPEAAIARWESYTKSPEKLKFQEQLWLPVIEDIESRLPAKPFYRRPLT